MKKVLLPIALLVSPLAAAQTAPPLANPNQVTVTDVPATHWAQQAVALAISRGWITGYPDGTFRGDKPVTRYQAALLLARVLTSGNLKSASSSDLQVIQAGIGSVQQELAVVLGRMDALAMLVNDQAKKIDDVTAAQQSSGEDIAILKGQVMTLQAAQADNQKKVDSALQTLSNTVTGASASAPATSALTSPANLPDTKFQAADAPSAAPNSSKFRAGGGVSYSSGSGVQAQVTAEYPFTKRLSGTLSGTINPKSSSGSLGLAAKLSFGGSADFKPYASLGFGGSFSPAYSSNTTVMTGMKTDLFTEALAGVDYQMANTLTLYAAAGARYYFSNNGAGTGLGADKGSGAAPVFQGGLKIAF